MSVISIAKNVLTDHCLAQARHALTQGHPAKGHQLARHALMQGVKWRNRRVEAEAYLVLGQAYLLESRIRLAYKVSSRANELFRDDSNAAGQSDSLAVMSHAASMLGRSEEAVRTADDGIALCGRGASPRAYAYGYNYLGVAATWSRDFARAGEALEASVWFAEHKSDAASAGFHPWVNLCFCELLQIVESERAGRCADLSKLRSLVLHGQAMAQKGDTAMLRPGTSRDAGLIMLDFASCFSACRAGLLEEAYRHFAACRDRTCAMPRPGWLQALVWWSRLELARAHGNAELSIRSAHAMGIFAKRGEHAQLQALAHSLEADVMTQSWT
ncbi:MAG TPA: hypothetical protein VKP68_02075 [Ramlibacter sp.]|nr:hypothetical protein [Ramlibacter sp.]